MVGFNKTVLSISTGGKGAVQQLLSSIERLYWPSHVEHTKRAKLGRSIVYDKKGVIRSFAGKGSLCELRTEKL